MTDKAAVEVPSAVEGKVASLGGDIGELMAVSSVLIRIEVEGEGNETGDAGDEVPEVAPAPEVEATPKASVAGNRIQTLSPKTPCGRCTQAC